MGRVVCLLGEGGLPTRRVWLPPGHWHLVAATNVRGTHPTWMHSCLSIKMETRNIFRAFLWQQYWKETSVNFASVFQLPPVSVALNSFCEVAEEIKKWADEHYGNIAIVPVLDTLHDVPWSGGGKYKVGSVLCETKWINGSAQDACPR